jgi:hypothetical protein
MLPSSGGVPLFFWRTGGARNFGASAQERSGTEIAKGREPQRMAAAKKAAALDLAEPSAQAYFD